MKRILLSFLFAIGVVHAADVPGDEPAKTPSLSVYLKPEAKTYYVGQSVVFGFFLDCADKNLVDLDGYRFSNLSKSQLDGLSIDNFRRVSTARSSLLHFQTRFVFNHPGTYSFDLSVSGTFLEESSRNMYYARSASVPFTLTSTDSPVCTVLPVPVEQRPACAVDAVGSYKISAGFVSTNCPPGGIATLLCTVRGSAAERIPPVFPSYDPENGFRTYPPRLIKQDIGELSFLYDFVLPSESGTVQPAPFSIATFDPLSAQWQVQTIPLPALTIAQPPPPPAKTPPASNALDELPIAHVDSPPPAPAPPQNPPAPSTAGCVSLRNETVRIAPAAQAQPLFSIPAGTPLRIRETFGDWYRALCPDGRSGWLPADAVNATNSR